MSNTGMFQGSKHGPEKNFVVLELDIHNNNNKEKMVSINLALISLPKICSKWITNLKVKHDTMMLRKQHGGKLR